MPESPTPPPTPPTDNRTEAALTDQQEIFCQSYAYYANAAFAAREAGYAHESARQSGHRLLAKPQVAVRIEEIREVLATRGCRTTAALLGKLENIHGRALDAGHYAAAARTVEIQARLAGLMPSVTERRRVIRADSRKLAESGDRDANHG